MKIAVDARELIGRPTGVGRYLAELLACWSREPSASGHSCLLMTADPLTLPDGLIGAGGARIGSEIVPLSSNPLGHLWWEQRTLPAAAAAARADVLFCPAYSGPLVSRVPVVVSMHDVSFWAHPEWFRPRERLRRRATTWAAVRRARLVLTLTAFSRDEILRWLPAAPDRVRAIAPGVGGFFDPHPLADGAPIGQADDDRPPIVLTVGSIFNRRHVDLLIRAVARIAPRLPDVQLAIVGENRTYPYQDLAGLARELGIADRVALRSFVSDDELRALYREARAFAFLSTYEGFGLTPLEAVVAGVPTVVADTEVAREVHAGLAHVVPAGDVDALADRLHQMLTEPPDPARQAALARAARARYPWSGTAAATLAALEEAAGAPQSPPPHR